MTKTKKIDITKKKILTVASDLFMSQGFKNTSTRDIAKEVGITQPALYHHFKNKIDIYEEVVLDLTNDVETELNSILTKDLDLEDKLHQIYRILVVKHPTNLFMMINDIMREMDEDKKYEMYLLWNKTYLQAMIHFVDEAKDKNFIDDHQDTTKNARYLLSAISPLIQVENSFLKKANIDDEIRSIVNFALHGIFT